MSCAGTLTPDSLSPGGVASITIPANHYSTITYGLVLTSGGGFQMGLMSEANYQNLLAGNTFSFYTRYSRRAALL